MKRRRERDGLLESSSVLKLRRKMKWGWCSKLKFGLSCHPTI